MSDAYAGHRLHYQLVDPVGDMKGTVAVDASSGQVYLIASLDREARDLYRFKVERDF